MMFLRKTFVLFCLLSVCEITRANTPAPTVSPGKLDQVIRETIAAEKYQWRMPRERFQEKERGLVLEFLDGVIQTMQRWIRPIKKWIDRISDWLKKRMPDYPFEVQGGSNRAGGKRILLIVLIAVIACLLAIYLWKTRLARRRPPKEIAAKIVAPVPDLTQEDVVADQLPEEGWQQMAEEFLASGEFRLAMRALFMATLAYLARNELITIARFKSNRDYQRELNRRRSGATDLVDAFSQNVRILERIWYGKHSVTTENLDAFSENQQKIRRAAA